MKENESFGESLDLEENHLPIRPLIIGGDDVTFLCPANMAILFTKTLVELLDAETPADAPEQLTEKFSRHMDACAGIAILPTKYPFFRGYKLAEQLCDEAKKAMRNYAKENNFTEKEILHGSSWLDFAILHGEQIRATEYHGARGNLHFGPYRLCNPIDDAHNIENLIACTRKFPDAMARNKIKKLRGILQRGQSDVEKFLQQLKVQDKRLPDVKAWEKFTATLWADKMTPYVDAIELMDFYVEEVETAWQSLKLQ